jgi:heme oxygenase
VREPGRRARLRSATLEAHARVDALIERTGFFTDRERYAAYLHATLDARHSIEVALSRSAIGALHLSKPERHVGPALRCDIRDVTGTKPPEAHTSAMPTNALTEAQVLGISYVLEGSALGARILAPRALALGMRPDFGARHLAVQISASGTWKEFLLTLEAPWFGYSQEDACIAYATHDVTTTAAIGLVSPKQRNAQRDSQDMQPIPGQ